MTTECEVPPILASLADAALPPLLLALLLGLPSAVLYCLQVTLILRHRRSHFGSSFFKLFAAKAIANLIGLVGAFLCQRFGMLGGPFLLALYLQLPRLCLASFDFLVIHFSHVEVVAIAILLLNRLTAIAMPFSYEKLWKRALPWAIATMYLLPLTVTWHIFSKNTYVRVLEEGSNFFALDNVPQPGDTDDVRIGAWSAGIFTLVSLCLNLGCLAAYRNVARKHQQQKTETQSAERNLTVYTLLTFLGQLCCTVYLILLFLVGQFGLCPAMVQALFMALYNQLPWVNDLNTIVMPAWLLLWASRLMRDRLMSAFRSDHVQPNSNTNPIGPRVAWSENPEQKY